MGQACARNSRNILEKNDDFKEIIVSYKIFRLWIYGIPTLMLRFSHFNELQYLGHI